MSSEIVPAILPKSFRELEEKVSQVMRIVPIVHLDVTDKTLTKDSSWPYAGNNKEFKEILEENRGLPYWEEVNYEIHLMVKDPERAAEDWTRAGVERLIVHLEAFESDEELSNFLAYFRERFDVGSTFLGVEIGLAVLIDTPLEKVWGHVVEADFIHFMSINEIGAQGNKFEPRIFDRIRELKNHFPDTILSVDGGVGFENAEDLMDAGVERLIVGSEIYEEEDPRDDLLDLIELVSE